MPYGNIYSSVLWKGYVNIAHFETYLMANRADPDQLASET